jgi:hypothetical protein
MRAAMPDQRSAASATPAPPASAAVRLPRWMFPLVTVVSLLLGATSIVRGTRGVVSIADSDLTNFFLKSADYILRGDPWHMYAVRALGGYPNYNPPLTMFLLAPLLGLARALGFAANYGEQITFVTLPFIVLVPLMGYLGLRVMRALYPQAPETLRLLLYVFITLSPLTWQSYSIWYHVEQPLMLCLLLAAVLALQARREGLAGLLAGLAFLTRTTALIPLIALGVLLLATSAWRPLLKFGGVSALVAALGFAPFLAFDSTDVKYTFLTWRGSAPIGSDSIWTIFAYTGTSSHLRELIDAGAKRVDMYSVILVVAVAAFLAVRRLRLTLYTRDLWALLAIAMLATPMLSKQVWPYYYLEPLVFIVVWELSTLQDRVAGVWRWPVLSIAFTLVAATLSQYVGLQSVGRLDALFVGVTQTALMALFAFGVWARIQARKPSAAGELDAVSTERGGMQPMTPPGMVVASAFNGAPGSQANPAQQMRPPAQRSQAPRPQPLVASPAEPPQTAPRPPRQPNPNGVGGQYGAAPGGQNPLWPADANAARPAGLQSPQAPEWWNAERSVNPAMPPAPDYPQAPRPAQGANGAQNGGAAPRPAPEGGQSGQGGLDPWRDWPNRR